MITNNQAVDAVTVPLPCPGHIGCLCIQLSEDEEVQGVHIDLLQPHVLVAPRGTAELCRELVLVHRG